MSRTAAARQKTTPTSRHHAAAASSTASRTAATMRGVLSGLMPRISSLSPSPVLVELADVGSVLGLVAVVVIPITKTAVAIGSNTTNAVTHRPRRAVAVVLVTCRPIGVRIVPTRPARAPDVAERAGAAAATPPRKCRLPRRVRPRRTRRSPPSRQLPPRQAVSGSGRRSTPRNAAAPTLIRCLSLNDRLTACRPRFCRWGWRCRRTAACSSRSSRIPPSRRSQHRSRTASWSG